MAQLRDVSEIAGWLRRINDNVERGANKGVIAVTQNAVKLSKQMTKVQFTGRGGKTKTGNLMNAIDSRFDIPKTTKGRPLLQGYVIVRAQKGNKGTKPYGRVHEFGKPSATDSEPIKPRKAKFLWLKNYEGRARKFKDLTPRDFVSLMRSEPQKYRILYPRKGSTQKVPVAWFFGELPKPKPRKTATRQKNRGRFFKNLKNQLPKKPRKTPTRKRTSATKWVPLFFLKDKVSMPARPFVRPAIQATIGPNGKLFWAAIKEFVGMEKQ